MRFSSPGPYPRDAVDDSPSPPRSVIPVTYLRCSGAVAFTGVRSRRLQTRHGRAEKVGRSPMKMASRVVVACPKCDTVRVPPDEICVQWCVDTDDWTYRSRCPKCRALLHASTSERLAGVVVGMGARLESWSLPAEIHERPG